MQQKNVTHKPISKTNSDSVLALEQKVTELNSEIIKLREDLFLARNKLYLIENSRLIGRIIKVRAAIWPLTNVKKWRGFIKIIGSKVLPHAIKKRIVWVRHQFIVRRHALAKEQKSKKIVESIQLENKLWPAKTPLASVVIPYYNRADTIDETLDSLKYQTYLNFEIIVVDDGSTDSESVAKINILKKENSHIRFVSQPNAGVAAARNNGIAQAIGKYIICLDSDDILEPTFIEKALLVLETSPDAALVTTHQKMFGVMDELYEKTPYDAYHLIDDNMVITAAMFRKDAWEKSGGYKSGIGYEDWDFWLTLAEHGYWGKLIPEGIFKYRTSMQSRYVEDRDVHWTNIENIRNLHPEYKKKVRKLADNRLNVSHRVSAKSALTNLSDPKLYNATNSGRNVLVTIPWMTFGGAETLIYNYCREIKERYNISFITALESKHEWEYKFREITPNIYHLPNLFEDEALYIEFVSNYIKTRNIDMLHIIHNGFTFEMLPELKKRHPELKVVVTMFNDRVEHFLPSVQYSEYIDEYVSDNDSVARHYRKLLGADKSVSVIPNGIDAFDDFNPKLFNRKEQRSSLGINDDELAVFFVGRLSVEKNPDVFLTVAKDVLEDIDAKAKFFMIGDGPMRKELEVQIKKIDNPNVVYLGYQSEIARYLSAADVFVLPSSIEGFPLSILEAMAMELAVIASKVGAVPDVIDSGNDGFVVSPGSSEDIRGVIEQLLVNPELIISIKTSARKKVEEKYSNRILAKNYRKLYDTYTS